MDILEKLERMAALPTGSEMPEWLSKEQLGWDVPLRKLFYDAAQEIKYLRSVSGIVSQGPLTREIKQSLPQFKDEIGC